MIENILYEGEAGAVEDVVAMVADKYKVEPGEALQKTEELTQGVVFNYPEMGDKPIQFLRDVLMPHDLGTSSSNIPLEDRAQKEHVDKKQTEAKGNILSSIESFFGEVYQDTKDYTKDLYGDIKYSWNSFDKEDTIDARADTINNLFTEFRVSEGVGDNVTDVPTGSFGMTTPTKNKIMNELGATSMSDEEASRYLIGKLYDTTYSLNPNMSSNAITGVVDAAYNLGEGYLGWTSVKPILENPNSTDLEVAETYLKRATVAGKSSRGIAKRRAISYNKTDPEVPIDKVQQGEGGVIKYLDKKGNVIYTFTAINGRHPTSAVKTTKVPN